MSKVSRNDNIKIGKHVYHVQTEYYSSSNKVVSNIFMDGKIVKRIESHPEGNPIDELISRQHEEILKKITSSSKKRKFKLEEEKREKLIELLSSVLGIATETILKEEEKRASSPEDLVSLLLSHVEENRKSQVEKEIKALLNIESKLSISEEEVEPILSKYFGIIAHMVLEEARKKQTPEEFIHSIISNLSNPKEIEMLKHELEVIFNKDRKRIPKIDEEKYISKMADFFGINTLDVFRKSVKTWKGKSTRPDELIDIICSHLESEDERERLREALKSI